MDMRNKLIGNMKDFPLNHAVAFLAVTWLCAASGSCCTSKELLVTEHFWDLWVFTKLNQLVQFRGFLRNFLR